MSDALGFAHAEDIDTEKFSHQPFRRNMAVEHFDCGSPPLNDFLNTREVHEYDKQNLGRTTLVYYENKFVAYYTTSADSLQTVYLQERKKPNQYVKTGNVRVNKIPAIMIGRLAVTKEYHNRGIGRYLIGYIIGQSIELSKSMAVRIIIVESKPESIDFYLKCGFQHIVDTRKSRRQRYRTLFLDLQAAIEAVAD